MVWPWSRTETRQADPEPGSYTADQVAEAVARAKGLASTAVATIEAAVGLWERAFMTAECPALAPWQLGMIGRALLVRGESLWFTPGRGLNSLSPVQSHDVTGNDADPATWRYRVTWGGPSGTRTTRAGAGRIMHVRHAASHDAPWQGRSPLELSSGTRAVLCAVERQLRDEFTGPVGSVVPVTNPGADLAADVAQLAGKVALVDAGDSGQGRDAVRDTWEVQRLGANPPQSTMLAHRAVESALLGACGVPVDLVLPATSGSAGARESWRRFIHGTIQPVSLLVVAELRRLGMDSTLSFERLFASDLAGRARAFGSLVQGGMTVADARRVCGFDGP